MFFAIKRAAAAALISFAGFSSSARSEIQDFEFQLVETEVKQGPSAIIEVRLIDKRSGRIIPDAVVFAQRLDMAPDGMETMTAQIEALAVTEPGVQRFRAKISMVGGWRLSIAAKLQGEAGTLDNKLVFKAIP